jgi:hypothetical protein
MSENVWTHSMARAAGSAAVERPPQVLQHSITNIGRRRLPPEASEYSTASSRRRFAVRSRAALSSAAMPASISRVRSLTHSGRAAGAAQCGVLTFAGSGVSCVDRKGQGPRMIRLRSQPDQSER